MIRTSVGRALSVATAVTILLLPSWATAAADSKKKEKGDDSSAAVGQVIAHHDQVVGRFPDRVAEEDATLRATFRLSDGRRLKAERRIRAGQEFVIWVDVEPRGSLVGVTIADLQMHVLPVQVILASESKAAQKACSAHREHHPADYAEQFQSMSRCVDYVVAGGRLRTADPDGDGLRFEADWCPLYAGTGELHGCQNLVRWGEDDPSRAGPRLCLRRRRGRLLVRQPHS